MTLTQDEEYDNAMRYLRTHGQTGKYYHTLMGLNYRMTDVEAAIGREQLKRLDAMVAVRRRNADILDAGLAKISGIRSQKSTDGSMHAYHQYCIVVSPEDFGCNRDRLSSKLKEKGIATGVHYPRGLHQQPIFTERYGDQKLPATEALSENILALPVHHGLVENDLEYIVGCVKGIQSKL
jgi:perosamine synthetase